MSKTCPVALLTSVPGALVGACGAWERNQDHPPETGN